MANSNRLAKLYLDELTKDPDELYQQGFAPLLRYLDANAPLSARIGYSVSPKQDCVRFGQSALLHFHSSAFTTVRFEPKTGDYKLKNSYWGMLGINGPLPSHLTEYAIERNYRLKDKTFTEFLDVFNHRFISLFYRAWADSEPTVSHDRPDNDTFKKRLNAFSGEANVYRDTFGQNGNVHQYLSGLFSHKNRSSKVLSQLLSEHLHLEVSISEFQGQWYQLEEGEQTQLGKNNSALGVNSISGNRTFQRSFNFAINIGPVDYSDYISLLDNKQRFESIVELTQKAVGQEYEFTINIILKPQQSRPSRLGLAKLGINSWCQDKSSHLAQQDPILVYNKAC
ncbi:type VI secretion system baseplate subunit TssG [Paraglaciecola arctica]|uniref:type VI secretion system baseplate subunit TssG n=1 Tax=Paraglaciecola arctica TaxID=1128911 RepID=UPI001C076555|nr:type VI secretion system baseplate subunit TssG [Paraglaciecola arctica]MBU3004978.1 type VI secretion system baseplate subunit TssG [Paraglaciecola arctica]